MQKAEQITPRVGVPISLSSVPSVPCDFHDSSPGLDAGLWDGARLSSQDCKRAEPHLVMPTYLARFWPGDNQDKTGRGHDGARHLVDGRRPALLALLSCAPEAYSSATQILPLSRRAGKTLRGARFLLMFPRGLK
jgi:hypothetical protein